MSLLNDALRQAEQRQGQARQPVYQGQAISRASDGLRRRAWLWTCVAGLAVVLVGMVLWFVQSRTAPQPPVVSAISSDTGPERTAAPPVPESATDAAPMQAPPSRPASTPQPVRDSEQASSAPTPVNSQSETGYPNTDPGKQDMDNLLADDRQAPAVKAEPQAVSVRPQAHDKPSPTAEASVAAAAVPAPGAKAMAPAADSQPVKPETATSEPVKSLRETPAAIDRRTENALDAELEHGELAAARQTLDSLLARQSAPRSRARFARFLLVDGQPAEALTWLPASVIADDPLLRLLRARALLALARVDESVATLESRVPPVAAHAEYTVTLATLLQQQGRFSDAALRWSELIAYDSDRSSWWVGLAIALESGQQPDSARRAYQQALALPDLPPALADYCTQRLNTLGAG